MIKGRQTLPVRHSVLSPELLMTYDDARWACPVIPTCTRFKFMIHLTYCLCSFRGVYASAYIDYYIIDYCFNRTYCSRIITVREKRWAFGCYFRWCRAIIRKAKSSWNGPSSSTYHSSTVCIIFHFDNFSNHI